MDEIPLESSDTSDESNVARIRPMSRLRRMLLPRDLRIVEKPMALELPNCSKTLIQSLIGAVQLGNQAGSEVTTKMSDDATDGMFAELALQVWRLRKRVDRIDREERRKERRQLEDSATRLERVLEDAGVIIDDPKGKPFVDGWVEVEVIAWDPIDEETVLPEFSGPWVKDTIKPIIRRNTRVIGIGQVVVVNPE